MMLNEITAAAGRHKRRKRVGRGESSGKGKTCGRGNKGCQSRAGGGVRRLTEGGQMPIFRRLPKRGFSNFNFRTEFETVNVCELERRFDDGAMVDCDTLKKLRLVQGADPLVKILAKGTLSKKLTVQAHAFSGKARELIEKAGGSVSIIERLDPGAAWKAKRFSAQPDRKKKATKAVKAPAPAKPEPEPPAESSTPESEA
ncbi:MAG: 50S ribosomal protein L15 [Phycisphaerae bacterium]|nr:50S ribosomal protein L15 [Phycisphaerae bacterium]